ncbi:hypothetical protein OA42_24580 [Klebsiella michiganensis]|nr:hypothetical protein OA42_24580 [Klebsiella michiganensis]
MQPRLIKKRDSNSSSFHPVMCSSETMKTDRFNSARAISIFATTTSITVLMLLLMPDLQLLELQRPVLQTMSLILFLWTGTHCGKIWEQAMEPNGWEGLVLGPQKWKGQKEMVFFMMTWQSKHQ